MMTAVMRFSGQIGETSRAVQPGGSSLVGPFAALAIGLCAVAIGSLHPAHAQPGAAPPSTRRAPVLHEPLPASARAGRTDRLAGDGNTSLADAIETANGRIEKPTKTPKNAPQPPLYEARKRRAKVATDRSTKAEGTLHYRTVFNPTIAPFKRDLAFDRVTESGALEQSGVGRRPIRPLGAATRPGHELFWGHVTVELVAGQHTPLPSISPSSAIVQAQSDPPRPLAFFVDAAGNFTVTSPKAGTVELRFVMDAASTYFAGPIGAGGVRDDPVTPRLPAAMQVQMARLWDALDVAPQRSRRHNVRKLTGWFRSFEPGELADDGDTAGLVAALIVARKGVCRHRAHGFVAMAHSLGIPAQYVINDAHAFVEVWVPSTAGPGRWQRVDLGGGADALQLHGANNKQLHDPLFADSLPRPEQYAGNLAQLKADGPLNGSSWAGARKVLGAAGLLDGGAGTASGAAQTAGDGARDPAAPDLANDPENQQKGAAWLHERALKRRSLARAVAAPDHPPQRPTAVDTRRTTTSIRLSKAAPVAYVGEAISMAGQVSAQGATIPAGLALEVWLIDPHDPTKGTRVGTALTRDGGAFTAKVAVPLTAKLGEFDLVVHFAGRGRLAASYSGP